MQHAAQLYYIKTRVRHNTPDYRPDILIRGWHQEVPDEEPQTKPSSTYPSTAHPKIPRPPTNPHFQGFIAKFRQLFFILTNFNNSNIFDVKLHFLDMFHDIITFVEVWTKKS